MLQIFCPLIFLPLFLIAALFERYLLSKKENLDFWNSTKIRSQLILILSSRYWLPNIIVKVLASFRCIKLNEQSEFMSINPNIDCNGDVYSSLLLKTSIPGSILFIIIFGFVFNRIRKSYKSSQTKISLKKEADNDNKISFTDLLIRDFRDRYYYWYVVEIIMLFFMVFLSQTTSSLKPIVQRMVLFVLLMTLFMIYSIMKPNHQQKMDRLICLSIICGFLSMICEVAHSRIVKTEINSENSDKYLSFVLVINLAFYLILLVNLSPRLSYFISNTIRSIFRFRATNIPQK